MELIGSRFGHIRIVDILGQGGMGDVYAGYDETLQRRVALKAIRPEQRLDAEARSRLIREARTLSQLEHPNICRIYDYIEGDEVDLLVLELIEGKTLEEALRDGVPPAEKLRIADAIARVLVAAHRAGIIHRDLKPENVMLTPAGEVKVLDFGLARWAEKTHASSGSEPSVKATESIRSQLLHVSEKVQNEWFPVDDSSNTLVVPTVMVLPTPEKKRDRGLLTAAGVTMGTPLYMSPEQARGETLTPASDMYSFGLVMQTLFTGREPYEATMGGREVMLAASRGESLPVIGTTRDITALIERLKQLAPTDRPTAVEALDRLRWIAERPKRLVRELTAAIVLVIVVLSAWKYVTDLRRERAAAVAAETEARARRAQAEDIMGFMLGDLRKKLEPVGRLDILDDVAKRALKYESTLQPEAMSAEEITRNAKALHQLGEVQISQRLLTDARRTFDQALRLTDGGLRRYPQDPELILADGTGHFWIGDTERRDHRFKQALPHMIAYRNAAERLAKLQPANDVYQLERSYGHSDVAAILESLDQLQPALADYQVARRIQSARVTAEPSDFERQQSLAVTINHIALVLEKLGDLAGARAEFDAEHDIYIKLTAADPKNMSWRRALAINESYRTLLLEMNGQTDAALQRRAGEAEVWRELATSDATNVTLTRNFAIAHFQYAEALRVAGKTRMALAEYATAHRLIRSARASDPQRQSWRVDEVLILIGRATALTDAKQLGEAEAALKIAESELRVAPSDPFARLSRAKAPMVHGDILAARGDLNGARAKWQEAVTALRPFAAMSSDPLVLDPYVRALLRLGAFDEARPIAEKLDRIGYRGADFMASRKQFAQ